MRIRFELLGSYLMDHCDLGSLQWSSLLKFTKTSKRLCSPTGTVGMRIGPTTVASALGIKTCPAGKEHDCNDHLNVHVSQ